MASTNLADSVSGTLAEIWARALNVPDVPLEGNFFELGGRSSTFVRVALEIEEHYGIEISLRDFFDAPTVAGLTDVVLKALATKSDPK
jgi:acyl carrier protein